MAKNRYSSTSPRDALEAWGRSLGSLGQQLQGVAQQRQTANKNAALGGALAQLASSPDADIFDARMGRISTALAGQGALTPEIFGTFQKIRSSLKTKAQLRKETADVETAESKAIKAGIEADIATETKDETIEQIEAISKVKVTEAGAVEEKTVAEKTKRDLTIRKLKLDVDKLVSDAEFSDDPRVKQAAFDELNLKVLKAKNAVLEGRIRIEDARTLYTPKLLKQLIAKTWEVPVNIFGKPIVGDELIVYEAVQAKTRKDLEEFQGLDIKQLTGDVEGVVLPEFDEGIGTSSGSNIIDPFE